MYSMFALNSRVSDPPSPNDFSPPNLTSLRDDQCLSTIDDVETMKNNLVVLVSVYQLLAKVQGSCVRTYTSTVSRWS